jgi:hypothetical protein
LIKLLPACALLFTVVQLEAALLFDDDAVLEVELTGPIGSVIANKKQRVKLPFTLSADGVLHKVEVRVRGKSRTRTRSCGYAV